MNHFPIRFGVIVAVFFVVGLCRPGISFAQVQVLDDDLHHLRSGDEREWTSFPAVADGKELTLHFSSAPNEAEAALEIRQVDVRQGWQVLVNDSLLGRLIRDEKDLRVVYSVPPGLLTGEDNVLTIRPSGGAVDDIRVGEITLHDRPESEVLSEGRVEIRVTDLHTGDFLPARLTIVDENGALQPVGATSNEHMAVRTGVVYTADGRASFGLPTGRFTIYATRGFEYGVDSTTVSIGPETQLNETFAIGREVNTAGYISCDTHIHTYTHSGHGDASTAERVTTLAGENIELPIATEHNKHTDYRPTAEAIGVSQYMTPVIGNEVTTDVGHFNIFPVESGAPTPDYRHTKWDSLLAGIFSTPNVEVVILNHGRDRHSGFRPFDPRHFNAAVGKFIDGREPGFNAMEVVNSGAQQSDIMRLLQDWFALLNRGYRIAPIGSSDSHDVSRFIVGQGRTYVRASTDDPSEIDVSTTAARIARGEVTVSAGLFAEITVEGYGPGHLVPVSDGDVTVHVRVEGPAWITADRVALYANGEKIRETSIDEGKRPGVKWEGKWTLSELDHDVHLVAVARGPGVHAPYWPVAKPYQPTSKEWTPEVIGVTGAVWLDGDGDETATAAHVYARKLVEKTDGDLSVILEALSMYDAAVAAQAAEVYHNRVGEEWSVSTITTALNEAAPHVRRGFQQYLETL